MSDKVYVGRKCQSFQKYGEYQPFSRVTMWYDDEHYYTAGDDTGRELSCENPWATQEIVDNALAQVKGYIYRPYEAKGCEIDPAAECGDAVTICGTYSVIGSMHKRYDALGLIDIAAPGGKELDHEYPCKSPQERELKRRVKLEQLYYGAKISRREGLVIEKTDGESVKAKVVLNADELSFYNGEGGRVLYFDPTSGTYKFMGELNVSDNFIVDRFGNVTIKGNFNLANGTIYWGDNPPNKKRYAASIDGPWHDTMQSGDIYCCDWDYEAEAWKPPYKFVGQDGRPGVNGSDADVTRANIVKAMLEAIGEDGLYTANINGKQCLGINATAIITGVLKALEIEGCTYYSQNRVGVLTLSDNSGRYSDLTFSNGGGYDLFSVTDGIGGAQMHLFGTQIFSADGYGNVELKDTVKVNATFA